MQTQTGRTASAADLELFRLTATARFAGWARTMSCDNMFHLPDDPYGTEIEAVGNLLPGKLAVVATAESKRNAPWGELLSTAARPRAARGAVVEGLMRDVKKIDGDDPARDRQSQPRRPHARRVDARSVHPRRLREVRAL